MPPALEQTLLGRYEAYWDAVYAAGDPGGGQPADPEDPALAAATMDPQLPATQAFLTTLRDQGQVLRGRPTTAPTVLAVLDYDQLGVVTDCVIDIEGSGVFDAATGAAIDPTAAGTSTPVTAELRLADATWKTSNLEIVEGRTCAQSDG